MSYLFKVSVVQWGNNTDIGNTLHKDIGYSFEGYLMVSCGSQDRRCRVGVFTFPVEPRRDARKPPAGDGA
jgi:hypothetical protein